MRLSIIIAVLVILSAGAVADDNVFGITIEQRALDVLTLMFQRLDEIRGATDLERSISIKAKVVVADVVETVGIMERVPKTTFWIRIELFKAYPDRVRVNLASSLGELQFLVAGSESLAVLPEDGVFARINIPMLLSPSIVFPEDDGGLFTMINLLGGIPLGSLLSQMSSDDTGLLEAIEFVEELDPSHLRATVRYLNKSKTAGGMVHVVGVQSALYKQYIKVWILEDTFDLYQISIEDERGTEIFLVIDELDTSPMPSEATFTLDTSDLVEISKGGFLTRLALKVAASSPIQGPVVADLYASSPRVARTGVVTIRTDGFDLQDKEDLLLCEVQYRSPGGSWTPLERIEYAGLAPLGHWDATFVPDETAELGMYSFRARYTDTSSNTSEWLEVLDMVLVTPAPPRIVQTKPVKGETGISVSAEINVIFSKPMDKHTVEKAFSVISEFGQIVRGSFTWEENTLIFSPSGDLRYDTTYLVRVNGEAMDTDNIGLDGNYDTVSDGIPYDDYLWTFKTSAATPMLSFALTARPVYIGDSFDVRVMAKYVKEMHKFSFKVVFNPEMLHVEKVDNASFASWRPRPKYIEEVDLWREPVVDSSAGTITIACDGTRRGGVSGVGYITTITFKAIGVCTPSLRFHEVSMTDSKGNHIGVELRTAELQVIEFHPQDVNHDGVVNILDFVAIASGETGAQSPRLAQFALQQNFPNPFNPETWIPYQLARPSCVTIRIYSLTGELIRTLDLGSKQPGFYTDRMKAAYWDGRDDAGQRVSSGVYFYTIQADGFTATKKMLLCK